jgi:Tol biopolymer transport system component
MNFHEISTGWYIVPLAGGPSSRAGISAHWSSYGTIDEAPFPLAWLRGNRILYRASSGGAINLWLATLSAHDGRLTRPPDQLTFGPGEITSASVSESGTVVFGNSSAQTRLWSFALERGKVRAEQFATLPSTGEIDCYPSISDTGKLAYLSQKFGKWNVWLTDLSSGKQTWLANVKGNRGTISVLVNRAGSRVAYTTCGERSMCTIFTVAATGGAPAKVCSDCGQLRSWSSDGRVMASQQPIREGQTGLGSASIELTLQVGGRRSSPRYSSYWMNAGLRCIWSTLTT